MVQMNWFAGQKLRHRNREQTYGHQGKSVGRGGGSGGMNWEIGIDIYTLICVRYIIKICSLKKLNLILKKVDSYLPLLNNTLSSYCDSTIPFC